MNKWLIALIIAIASGTTAQVWIINTPAIASMAAEQTNDQEDIKYIRDKVDRIYDEVRQR